MKTKVLLFILLVICHLFALSQTVSITNIQVSQRTDGSGLTDIYFNLSGASPNYYITAEASFDNGTTFTPIPQASLSGDTGPIIAGTGKHIIWNGLQSFPNTFSTQAQVKLNISTSIPAGFPCPGIPTVTYGGQVYNTVQIGTQCWFKENLNIGAKINGTANQTNNNTLEKYCYDDLESNCNIYGGLYQWNEMMQYLTTAGVQGICPAGWHIPQQSDWTAILTFLGGTMFAGGIMKSTGTIEAGTGLWYSPNSGATNESGFTAVPTGERNYDGLFGDVHSFCPMWGSSELSADFAWYQALLSSYSGLASDYSHKNIGFAVRCILDL